MQVGNPTPVGAPPGTNGDYMLLAHGGGARLAGMPLSTSNVAGPVRISFDMFTGSATTASDWTSFTLRANGDGFPIVGSGEFGFLFRANTGIQIFNNGGVIADFGSTSGQSNFAFYLADSAGTGSPFAGNGTRVVVTQGGSQLGSYALDTGMAARLVAFGSTGTRVGGVDNLAIDNFQNNLLNPATSLALTSADSILELEGVHQTVASLSGVAGSQVKLGPFTRLTIDGSADSTFSGTLSGTLGSIAKSGSSTFTLGGTNYHSGSTTVTGGTLAVTGAITASPITVASGATLDLTGSTAAPVTINPGATLTGHGGLLHASVTLDGIHAPGNSPGLQTFTAGLSYGPSSSLEIELASDTIGLRGIDHDAVDVTGGNLTISPTATLVLLAAGIDYSTAAWDAPRSFLIIDYSGGASSTGSFLLDPSQAGSYASQGSWSLDSSSGDTLLLWTAIPEPNAALLAATGLLAALRRRRHQR